MANKNLHAAKAAKKDEFYTRLEDIAAELRHYRDFFRGKSVLCNCDDPYESNFFKFFALNFNSWGLRRLVATCYDGSPVAGRELSLKFAGEEEPKKLRTAYKIVITEVPDMNGDGATDMTDVACLIRNRANVLTRLGGNGDFRSAECVEMLREADVVVTNPPFSLFREYVAQLMEYGKKFLIIGNQNNVTYKDIFLLLMENKMWLGYNSGDMAFRVPQNYEARETRYWQDETGQKWRSMGNISWFTNIDHTKRHETLDLYKRYSSDEYQTFDNFPAINVSKVAEIPLDYDGIMGVPITFMDKYNPDQFEILGLTQIGCHDLVPDTRRYDDYGEYRRSDGMPTGASGRKTNENAVLTGEGTKKTFYKNAEGRVVHSEYKRILIRKRKNNSKNMTA